MPAPATVTTVFATDEDVAVRAPDDLALLVPASQVMARADDGVITSGDRWTLSSASVDFAGYGVQANGICLITGPKPAFRSSTGELFAIDSVASSSIVLRRVGKGLGVGQPAGPAVGVVGVSFSVPTLGPQIEVVSYDLYRRYGIDDNVLWSAPGMLYDQRDLRQLCVLLVLEQRYTQAMRDEKGDFAIKLKNIEADIADLVSRVSVRWGTDGNAAPPRSPFGGRITR